MSHVRKWEHRMKGPNLIRGIQSGKLSKLAFQKMLQQYESERGLLIKSNYGPDVLKAKLRGINLSISLVQLFIEKFDDLTNKSGG